MSKHLISGTRGNHPQNQFLVFFDGVCSLCNGFVKFYDPKTNISSIRYIPLQSDEAKALLGENQLSKGLETIIVLKNGKVYEKSEAFFQLMKNTSWPWKGLSLFIVVPKGIADSIYDWIAKNRYSLFGKTDQCVIDTFPAKKK